MYIWSFPIVTDYTYAHDVSKADCIRFQVHYDVQNEKKSEKNQKPTNSYVRDKTIQTSKYTNSLYEPQSTNCNKIK